MKKAMVLAGGLVLALLGFARAEFGGSAAPRVRRARASPQEGRGAGLREKDRT